MIPNTNDGTSSKPYLRVDINYGNCNILPSFSTGPKGGDREKHCAIKESGFEGIQDGIPELCKELGLNLTAHARINKVGELDQLLPIWEDGSYNCATLHVGWGMESDTEANKLLNYILNASETNNFPVYIETHRATITQDMQRTVEYVKRFPEIRFNGDFSHWYTGQEMVYGGIENKWDFIQPVFNRVRFLHGRIGNPGSIQVDIGDGKNLSYVEHFKEMWTRSFVGFLKSAQLGDYICFTIELLPSDIYYARTVNNNGELMEEGDRWQQALIYKKIANECWSNALKRISVKS